MNRLKFLHVLLVVLIGCFPVALMSSDYGSDMFYYILLLSLISVCVDRQRAAHFRSCRWVFAGWFVLLLGVMLSLTLHGHWDGGDFEKAARFSIGLPVVAVGLMSVDRRWLRWATLGLYAAAWISALAVFHLVYTTLGRPDTPEYNAVSYANLMMWLAVCAVYGLHLPLTRFVRTERALKWLTALVVVAGVVLTQTRSSWMAVPVFALIWLLLHNHWRRPGRAVLMFLGVVLAVVVIAETSTSLRHRMDAGVAQLEACHGVAATANTSVCIRMQLWRVAVLSFAEHPWDGLGTMDAFSGALEAHVPKGMVSSFVSKNFGEPHNDMLQVLSSYGVLAGLGLLLVYFVPAALFLRRLRQSDDALQRTAAAMGLALTMAFAIYGLTELMFRGMRTVGFFSVMVAWLLSLSREPKSDPVSDPQIKDTHREPLRWAREEKSPQTTPMVGFSDAKSAIARTAK